MIRRGRLVRLELSWEAGAMSRRMPVSLRVKRDKPHELIVASVASMVLLNNDISSIVDGIEMGRLVFDNLKKVILYLLPVSSL